MQRDRNDAHQPDRRGGSAVPTRIVIEIAPEEQARLLAKARRASRNQWLTLHIVLLLALHRSPSEIAAFLLCARSTVYRAARDWQAGDLGKTDVPGVPWPPCLPSSVRGRLLALLKKTPSACGWCRTRWSCAAPALQLQAQRGICQSQLKNPHFAAVEISSPVAVVFPHFVSLLPFPSSAMAGLGAAVVFASSPALRFSLRR